MSKLRFISKRQILVVIWSWGLLPLTSFAQNYQETNLVTNAGGQVAKSVDPDLVNPWGIARSSTGPWWVADQARGVSTLYDGEGNKQALVVTVPHAGHAPIGSPTGIVFNGSSDFDVEPNKPAIFIFASLDGTISAWNPQVNPTVAIEKVKAIPGSELTGAASAQIKNQRFLYVVDLHEGKVKVFDKNFHPVQTAPDAFRDGSLPEDFVPFNVQNIGGNLYVAFAQQNQAKNFVNFAAGLGTVDIFSPEGILLQRLERGSWFNAPWGLALAPTDFGTFSHSLLVGQFGSGEILAFDVVTGRFQGKLRDQTGKVINVPGLWAIAFGAGNSNSGDANDLYFNAGLSQGNGGLFGYFSPVATELTQGNDQ